MPRIGLVLGAGGLAGTAFHAGVVGALADRLGWDARDCELVVGTSAGSTTAAMLRAGLSPEDYFARVAGGDMSTHGRRLLASVPPMVGGSRRRARGWPMPASTSLLRRAVLRPGTVRPGALLAAALPPGATPNEDIVGVMSALHHHRWPDRDLWICAVRLDTGARVVFGRDRDTTPASVGQAVAASCAIPGYYQPTVLSDVRYVDGGVRSLCNLDVVAGAGLDLVVVSAPMSTSDWFSGPRDGAWRIPARTQLEREAAKVRRRGTEVVLLHPDEPARGAMRGASMDPRSRPAIARTVRASVLDGLDARGTRLLASLRTA